MGFCDIGILKRRACVKSCDRSDHFFFVKRFLRIRYSTPPKTAQRRMPRRGETVEASMLPMEPKNPKKQTALSTVFSIFIAVAQVKSATIMQIALISLSPI